MSSQKYIVIEMQTNNDGAVSTLVWAYDTRNQAESKFHSVLSAAAISELPIHAASLLQSDGRLLDCRSYEHGEPEPEPESGE